MFIFVSTTIVISVLVLFYFLSIFFSRKDGNYPTADLSHTGLGRYAALVFGLFTPLMIFLHESSHYFAGRLAGLKLIFLHDRILIPPQPRPENFESKMLWFTLSGPLVELTLATTGIILIWKFRRKVAAAARPIHYWFVTLFTIASFRWLRVDLDSSSDERAISVMLGFPPWAVATAMIPLALFSAWLLIDIHRRNGTMKGLTIAIVAGLGSVILYLYVWGARFAALFSGVEV